MTRKIFDWVTIGLTFVLIISALGVVGSFEQDRLDAAGFFIGQAVCIAGIAMLAVVHHLLSKKEKAPEERQLLLRAIAIKTVFIIARKGKVCQWWWIFLTPIKSIALSMQTHLGRTKTRNATETVKVTIKQCR